MLDVILALLPAMGASVYYFGIRAALVILVTVASTMLTEFVTRKWILKRDFRLGDLSAIVTGILLALTLPPSIPLWIAAVGGVLAIFLVKEIFGGLGQNFMNPALGSRVFLFLAWPAAMTAWVQPVMDAVASPTPLAILKGKEVAGAVLPQYIDLFLGNRGGCLGETSVLALLIGAAYLILRRVIHVRIPFVYLGTVALLAWIFGDKTAFFHGNVLAHLMSGGLILGAFFMATDYATQPIAVKGKWIYAIGLGILTIVIRLYTNYPEGVMFAIILMNTVVPIIDRHVLPRTFGGKHA
jgi:electron transport complex protein RnfD